VPPAIVRISLRYEVGHPVANAGRGWAETVGTWDNIICRETCDSTAHAPEESK